ncbi:uncharacterized protein UTRI_04927 [Ustilago trichophora]|uniref:HTH CENPB-type domain-containing protein n=1 Tax=Ustilago trichophora TaxID=86804 RepID=A0A5C3EE90_9BASI|nr:uncharacterized protein UTRI_04927 [Ustilago trichophora]
MSPQMTKAKRDEFCSKTLQREEAIRHAIRDINSGAVKSIRKAAELHNVPYSPLQRRLKGIQARHNAHTHRQLLSEAQEKSLQTHIETTAAQGFPINYKELMDRAAAFNKENLCNQEAMISRKWARGFLYRHPSLLSCFSRVLDHSRAKVSNRATVTQYYELLRSTMVTHDIPFCHVYNMDETGFVFGRAQSHKVLVQREKKRRHYSGHNQDNEKVQLSLNALATKSLLQ